MAMSTRLVQILRVLALLAAVLGTGAVTLAVLGQSTTPVATSPMPLAANVTGFVTRTGPNLELNGQEYTIAGANFYPALVSAASGGIYRNNVTAVLRAMQGMSMNVMRTWAFNDGPPGLYEALQISPGQLDETVFSQGMDWIVAEAPKYGIKLLLTLTNGAIGYGGMQQYVAWSNLSTVQDFYTSPQINTWYQDYVKAIVTRNNTITGIQYNQDPAILGWELANEAWNPGDDSGDILHKWYQTQANYVKGVAPLQLLSLGGRGKFGASTPNLIASNPIRDQVFGWPKNNGSPYPEASICYGEDFSRNNLIPEVDLASVHIYPDAFVCNLQCKLNWAHSNLMDHLSEATRLQKPLLVGEFNMAPYNGLSDRNTFLRQIYSDLQFAATHGQAVAGTLVWMLAVDASVPGYNGWNAFNIYPTPEPYAVPAGVQQEPAAYPNPTSIALEAARIEEFIYNNGSLMTCSTRLFNGPSVVTAFTGWNETIAIMQQNAKAVAV